MKKIIPILILILLINSKSRLTLAEFDPYNNQSIETYIEPIEKSEEGLDDMSPTIESHNLDNIESKIKVFLTGNLNGYEFNGANQLNNEFISRGGDIILDIGNFTMNEDEKNLDFMDRISYTAINLGINEIKRGKEFVDSLKESLGNKLVSANLLDESGNYYLNPYLIKEIELNGGNKLKIAITGLIFHNDYEGSLVIDDYRSALDKIVNQMEDEGINFSFLLTSGNIPDDFVSELEKYNSIALVASEEEVNLRHLPISNVCLSKNSNIIGEYLIEVDEGPKGIERLEGFTSTKSIEEFRNYIEEIEENENLTFEFPESLNFSAYEDTLLCDLFQGAILSHFSAENKNTDLPVVSMVNIFSTKSKLPMGEVSSRELRQIFPSKERLLAININGEGLLNIIEKSFSIFETTSQIEKIRLNSDKGFTLVDFYDNISFQVDSSKNPGFRIINPILLENNRSLEAHDEIILLLPKERFNKLKKDGLLEDTIVEFWESKDTITNMFIRYLEALSLDGDSFECNNNWSIITNGVDSLSQVENDHSLINNQDIPHYLDEESPIAQLVLKVMKEKEGADISLIDKRLIKNGLIKGPINNKILSNLFIDKLSITSNELKGADIKTIVEKDVINGDYQAYGINIQAEKGEGEDKIINLTDSNNLPIEDNKLYKVALTEKSYIEGDNIEDSMANYLIKEKELSFDFKPTVSKINDLSLIDEGENLSLALNEVTYNTKATSTRDAVVTYNTKSNNKLVFENSQNKENPSKEKNKGKTLPNAGYKIAISIILIGIILIVFGLKILYPNKLKEVYEQIRKKLKNSI